MQLGLLSFALLLCSSGVLGAKKPCGGLKNIPCPEGYTCVDNPHDKCDPKKGGVDCIGYCVRKKLEIVKRVTVVERSKTICGGFAGLSCPKGQVCVDDPNDDCDPYQGGADCSGYCVKKPPKGAQACGGFAGIPCPQGLVCVDDPTDSCDPKHGGADCIGYCAKKRKGQDFETVTTARPPNTKEPCKHKTVCVDEYNNCGVHYGGCYNKCTTKAFHPPKGCNKSKCKHNTICVDYFDKCGNTYGPGCHDTCHPATYTKPYCPKET